ncbi:hypothetical protein ABPG75_007535 [Micractinium tetrahymenae]
MEEAAEGAEQPQRAAHFARRALGGLLAGPRRLEGTSAEQAEQRRKQEAEQAAATAAASAGRAERQAPVAPQAAEAGASASFKTRRRREGRRRAAQRLHEVGESEEEEPDGGSSGAAGGPRVVSWSGDWLCPCGSTHTMYQSCTRCCVEKPCRDYLRGECNLSSCRFPHLPLDLPERLPPSSQQVVHLYNRSILYKPARSTHLGGTYQRSILVAAAAPAQAAAPTVQHLPAASSTSQSMPGASSIAVGAAPVFVPVPYMVPMPLQQAAGMPGSQPAGYGLPAGSTEQQVAQLAALMQQVLSRLPPEVVQSGAVLPGSGAGGSGAAHPEHEPPAALLAAALPGAGSGTTEEAGRVPAAAEALPVTPVLLQAAERAGVPPHLVQQLFPPGPALPSARAVGPLTPASAEGPLPKGTAMLQDKHSAASIAATHTPAAVANSAAPAALVQQLLPPAGMPAASAPAASLPAIEPQQEMHQEAAQEPLPQSFICPITQAGDQQPEMCPPPAAEWILCSHASLGWQFISADASQLVPLVLQASPCTIMPLQEPMRDPVVAADGHTYERAAIAAWLQHSAAAAAAAGRPAQLRSPMTNQPLEHAVLVPNRAVRAAIQEVMQRRAGRGSGSGSAAAAFVAAAQQ